MSKDQHHRHSAHKTSTSKKSPGKGQESFTSANFKKAVTKNIKKYKGVLDILSKK